MKSNKIKTEIFPFNLAIESSLITGEGGFSWSIGYSDGRELKNWKPQPWTVLAGRKHGHRGLDWKKLPCLEEVRVLREDSENLRIFKC